MQLGLSAQHIACIDRLVKCCALEIIQQTRMSQDMDKALKLIFTNFKTTEYIIQKIQHFYSKKSYKFSQNM